MSEESGLICCDCNLVLVPKTTVLKYMGITFNTTLPKCPKCGNIYISEEIVAGKMLEVEKQLEDK